jgi:molybdopterin/thiamine biosynthesis adenylyltransferase
VALGEDMEFSQEELLRYNRQLIIPDIGEEGQRKIRDAKVFVAGVGGLGSISSYYLAAAGIGQLKIVDKDTVDYSNLNRQIIHWTTNIGEAKTDSGLCKLKALNPHCAVEAVRIEINESNYLDLVGECDLIVDAMDNMAARRLVCRRDGGAPRCHRVPFLLGTP